MRQKRKEKNCRLYQPTPTKSDCLYATWLRSVHTVQRDHCTGEQWQPFRLPSATDWSLEVLFTWAGETTRAPIHSPLFLFLFCLPLRQAGSGSLLYCFTAINRVGGSDCLLISVCSVTTCVNSGSVGGPGAASQRASQSDVIWYQPHLTVAHYKTAV